MSNSSQSARDNASLKQIQQQIDRQAGQPSGLVDLAHALAGTDAALDAQACDVWQALLPEYIEAEIKGEPARRRFPDVARHLEVCATCAETYVDLLELALASEEEPLPVPVPLPAIDLGFLPRLSPAEQFRQLVEQLTAEVARHADAALLGDLPAASRQFFRRIQDLGEGWRPRSGPAPALAFGQDPPPGLQAVWAAYTATHQVLRAFSVQELATELNRERPSSKLEKRVRRAFESTGLRRREAELWTTQYLEQIRAHASDLLDLARRFENE